MHKIRKIKFIDHPMLGNLELDFCDQNGNAVETVIIAGENGTGKSTVMNVLYQVSSHSVNLPLSVEIENDGKISILTYLKGENGSAMRVKDNHGMNTYINIEKMKQNYPFSGIFSDVDISFHAGDVSNVTSLTLDETMSSRRSTDKLPTQINQLIVDIQAMDDGDLAYAYRNAKAVGKPVSEIIYQERMSRFTNAFDQMFEKLTYSRIENVRGKKSIIFKKNGTDIPISGLSSGEKQVVYRGCFLLKDVQAMNGAFVFIDEPEISLHPNWQLKIMNYYRGIFTDKEGKQTSQIFAVTHSPFIIHNENRRNDKVIVLARDEAGNVVVKDRPEYFKCTSTEAVEDAFSIRGFSAEQPTVYLEGQTDEKYFNKAVEVFDIKVPFNFKWVGYIDERGQEANTGDKSVDKAFQFLVARDLPIKNICLKDCDTKRETVITRNVIATSIPKYDNKKGISRGIENALVLDTIDLTPFYVQKEKVGNYGEKTIYQEFDKMACCDAICSMNIETQKNIFCHLKEVVEELIKLYSGE